MLDFGFYNMDCMDGMREFPDNYFDLAIVDPPYGDGGGTWKRIDASRFGGRVRQVQESINLETPASGRAIHCPRGGNGCTRTGGTWATKFGKKLSRGI